MATINLLPWREELREERNKRFYVVIAAVVLVSAALGIFVSQIYSNAVSNQQARNDYLMKESRALDAKIDEIKELKETRSALIDRMELIQALQGNRPVIVRIFDEIARAVPDELYFTKLEVKGDVLVFEGVASSNKRISDLMRRFDSSDWFGNPVLESVQSKGSSANQFKLSVSRRNPNAEDE
ncbi:MAG: pilus assembly protein PilN [Pseudomonas sp.]|nr:pilus assembly protein PilN [Pseudomonas sp.]